MHRGRTKRECYQAGGRGLVRCRPRMTTMTTPRTPPVRPWLTDRASSTARRCATRVGFLVVCSEFSYISLMKLGGSLRTTCRRTAMIIRSMVGTDYLRTAPTRASPQTTSSLGRWARVRNCRAVIVGSRKRSSLISEINSEVLGPFEIRLIWCLHESGLVSDYCVNCSDCFECVDKARGKASLRGLSGPRNGRFILDMTI